MTKLEILEKFLKFTEDVINHDKTPPYDYGNKLKRCQNARGKFPEAGERWLTPAEMAWAHGIDIKREIELTKNEVEKC